MNECESVKCQKIYLDVRYISDTRVKCSYQMLFIYIRPNDTKFNHKERHCKMFLYFYWALEARLPN